MDRARLRRIRNWQSSEWYAALVIRPLAILVMLVIADWRWVTPNRLTTAANVAKLAAAWLILDGRVWPAAVLLQLGLLLDHLDGTLARYRRISSELGSFYDKVSDVFTWFAVTLAAAWTTGDTTLIALAAAGAYALLMIGYMKWLSEALRGKLDWLAARADPAAAVARHTAAPAVAEPPARTAAEWARWFLWKLVQVFRFEEVDLFFWLGLALVTSRLDWYFWIVAATQTLGVAIMAVRRGLAVAQIDATRAAPPAPDGR